MTATEMPLAGGLGRARRKLRSEGPGATLRHAGRLLRRLVYLNEQHVWYRLDLSQPGPGLALPEGVRVARAGAGDVDGVGQLGQDIDDAHRHYAEGHELWLTREGDAALFACWIFRGSAPLIAAPGGTLELAPGTVCLEDSFTSQAARGRGIAPASWCEIAGVSASEGSATMITKVEVENAPSRRAVTKAGFREVAVMKFVRLLIWERTTLDQAEAASEDDLASRLGARASFRRR